MNCFLNAWFNKGLSCGGTFSGAFELHQVRYTYERFYLTLGVHEFAGIHYMFTKVVGIQSPRVRWQYKKGPVSHPTTPSAQRPHPIHSRHAGRVI
jgi:hypothetical protein